MITLVTGGARSGKSSFAESLLKDESSVLYMATARVEDKEMEDRVAKHQERRPSTWGLFEGDRNLSEEIQENYSGYLLDCLTVLSSNHMFDITEDRETFPPEIMKEVEDSIFGEVEALIKKANEKEKNLVIVTNEIGDAPVPMYAVTRAFRDIQGRVNQRVAHLADLVYLVVCGIPVKIK